MAFGKSIRIYLKDATVGGIRIGEIVNHTIQCIACPRSRIAELKQFPQTLKPGVYFLFGIDDTSGSQISYIGEGENVLERLQSHFTGKEFWNEVLFFVSKDDNLTKSHVRFLESKIIVRAKLTNRYIIENIKETDESPLPESDRDAMEEFLTHIELLLGVFAHKILESPLATSKKIIRDGEQSPNENTNDQQKYVQLFLNTGGITASGMYTDEGLVVLKNSQAIKDVQGLQPGYVELRETLKSRGIMILEGNKYIFKDDYLFKTPSPAAAVIVGYSINGRDCWKDKHGRSINELKTAGLL